MGNIFSKYFNRSKKALNPNLEKVYTDSKGNDYFKFVNPALMPASRLLLALIRTGDADRCMNNENLRHLTNLIDQKINANDLAGVAKVNGIIQASLDQYADEETLLKLAEVYFLMNDESPDKFYPTIQKEKRLIWEQDLSAKGFFLQQSFKYTRAFPKQPQLNVLEYLEKTRGINQVKETMLNLLKKSWKAKPDLIQESENGQRTSTN